MSCNMVHAAKHGRREKKVGRVCPLARCLASGLGIRADKPVQVGDVIQIAERRIGSAVSRAVSAGLRVVFAGLRDGEWTQPSHDVKTKTNQEVTISDVPALFRLWLGLKALALARIWRLWLLKIPGQAAPSRLGLAWAGFGLSRGFCRNFGIIIDCSNTTTPSSYLRHPKHVTRKVTLMCDLGGSGDGIQEPQGKKMAAEGQIMMAPVKAGAFRLGFGLEECQAGPKAVSGRYFGSALARYQSQKAGAFWPEAKAGTSLVTIRVVKLGFEALEQSFIAIEMHKARNGAGERHALHRTSNVVEKTAKKEVPYKYLLQYAWDCRSYSEKRKILSSICGEMSDPSGTASATTSMISFTRRAIARASDLQCRVRYNTLGY
ncbi:hypothetical protein B0H12DRAFT_1070746 [Mycena haematopus]|nr:hypothetical protein B0H12DRAFT_1070746 [Mycena haematopus]